MFEPLTANVAHILGLLPWRRHLKIHVYGISIYLKQRPIYRQILAYCGYIGQPQKSSIGWVKTSSVLLFFQYMYEYECAGDGVIRGHMR